MDPGTGEALRGWGLAAGGMLVAALLALAYFFGLLGERAVASLVAAAFVLLLAGIAVHAGFESPNGRLRAGAIVFGLGCLLVAALPASIVLLPGRPVATGVLRAPGDSLKVPEPGEYRLLASAPLKRGEPGRLEYRLAAGERELEGALELLRSLRRGRRGGASPVVEDHSARAHDLRLEHAATRVTLKALDGKSSASGLTLRVYRRLPAVFSWAAMALLLGLGLVLEGKLAARGGVVMPGAAAAAFGLAMGAANPLPAVGPVLGAAILGAGTGVVAGSVLRVVARRLFAPAGRRSRAATLAEGPRARQHPSAEA